MNNFLLQPHPTLPTRRAKKELFINSIELRLVLSFFVFVEGNNVFE